MANKDLKASEKDWGFAISVGILIPKISCQHKKIKVSNNPSC